jgi:hypothetical protein
LKYEALIDAMKIFGSTAAITSTPKTFEELPTDIEDEPPRPSYPLNEPIRPCACGIGPELFSS